ncbi:hypothetical protein [Mycoplasma marinum]|uniref:Uncharacterized protein n=1 Tax=Mycoplasma marinum TaxID=1937190 RepID=A0A4V2NI10_9MOLU|nr:hypothetical protein [Mycoplasma marinum]TCG11058.1 hypothetical protein C4B24_03170 [Mycoplasma marinum]
MILISEIFEDNEFIPNDFSVKPKSARPVCLISLFPICEVRVVVGFKLITLSTSKSGLANKLSIVPFKLILFADAFGVEIIELQSALPVSLSIVPFLIIAVTLTLSLTNLTVKSSCASFGSVFEFKVVVFFISVSISCAVRFARISSSFWVSLFAFVLNPVNVPVLETAVEPAFKTFALAVQAIVPASSSAAPLVNVTVISWPPIATITVCGNGVYAETLSASVNAFVALIEFLPLY